MKYVLTATTSTDAISAVKNAFDKSFTVINKTTLAECLETFIVKRPEFSLIDISLLKDRENGSYKKTLRKFWEVYPPTAHIIVLVAQNEIREAVSAVKSGATNYITYPIDSVELKFIAENSSETMIMEQELDFLRENSWQTDVEVVVRTNSKLMKDVYSSVKNVANTNANILITGETGTGKSLLAKLIHSLSNRKK